MSIASGIFSVTCDFCRTHAHFPAYEANFVSVGEDTDRQMGAEKIHSWEQKFNCSGCNKEIELNYNVSEYPEGSYNNEELRVKGGTVYSNYTFKFDDNLYNINLGQL